jgi:hypothetical protein
MKATILNPNNLSCHPNLNDSSLKLGQKFIPRPKPRQKREIHDTLSRLRRNLLISTHFRDKPPTKKSRLQFPSKWEPTILTTPLQRVETFFKTLPIWLREYKAPAHIEDQRIQELTTLRDRPDIKITSSDKNLGLVIHNTIDYHKAMTKLLSAPATYVKLDSSTDVLNEITQSTLAHFDQIKPLFTTDELNFIYSLKNRLHHNDSLPQDTTYWATFHGLPKLHKGKLPPDLPFRPIVASRPSQLQSKVSIILTDRLLPIMGHYKRSILKNAFDLKLLYEHQHIPKSSFVTFDFESLYTNIPLAELYELIRLDDNNPLLTPKLKKHTIRMLKFVFNNNYFIYGNDYFKQLDGIAMGTNCAVVIANLYLALKFDNVCFTLARVSNYKRYIDDGIFLYKGTQKDFESFDLRVIKRAAHPLTITYVFHSDTIDFLDCNLYKKDNKIHFKVYQKQMNQYAYIRMDSFHPTATLKGFITSEIRRYRSLSTLPEDANYIIDLFYTRLKRRGYSDEFLQPLFKAPTVTKPLVRKRKSEMLLEPRHIPLILRYTNEPRVTEGLKTFLDPLFKDLNHNIDDVAPFQLRHVFKSNPNVLQLTSRSQLSPGHITFLSQIDEEDEPSA